MYPIMCRVKIFTLMFIIAWLISATSSVDDAIAQSITSTTNLPSKYGIYIWPFARDPGLAPPETGDLTSFATEKFWRGLVNFGRFDVKVGPED